MGLGVKGKKVKEVYDRIDNAGNVMAIVSERMIGKIDKGPINYITICDDMIPQLRDMLKNMPDSSGFPQVWLDRLSAYAAAQAQTPSADYMADYEAVRAACAAVITEGIAITPVDAGGNLLMRKIDSAGYMIRNTTTQTDTLKSLLGTLITAAS